MQLEPLDPEEEARRAFAFANLLDRRIGNLSRAPGAGGYSADDAARDARQWAHAHNQTAEAIRTAPNRWLRAFHWARFHPTSSLTAGMVDYLSRIEPTDPALIRVVIAQVEAVSDYEKIQKHLQLLE